MIVEMPLGLGSYEHETSPYANQVCQNMYSEAAESPSLSKTIYLPTPGIELIGTTSSISSGANRGAGRLKEKPYFVNGNQLHRLNADGTIDDLGTIPGSGRVFMAENPTQLLIVVPGVDGYIYTEEEGLSVIEDIDYKEANGVPKAATFIDGYFLCVTDQNRITVSALNDGTDWSALDFASAESSPDGLVAPMVHKNQLYIAGTETFEQYTNVGGADFPFERTNSFQEKGLSAPHAFASTASGLVFMGAGPNERPAIYLLADESLGRISTHPVDQELSRLTADEVADVYAWSYMEDGHQFIAFQLPSRTYVYDLSTSAWHTRTSRVDGDNGQVLDVPCRVASTVSAYGEIYVGDTRTGNIGVLTQSAGSEYGNAMLRELSTQPYHNDRDRFYIPYLELAAESGTGFDVEMSISADGGRTWADPRKRTLDDSVYTKRAVWRRCGRFKEAVSFRFRSASSNRVVFIGVYADVVLDEEKEADLKARRQRA